MSSESDTGSDSDRTSTDECDDDEIISFRKPQKKSADDTAISDASRESQLRARAQALVEVSSTQINSDPAERDNGPDDTDGLDPEKEFSDWKERELRRVEREINEIQKKEEEIQAKLENRAKRQKIESSKNSK